MKSFHLDIITPGGHVFENLVTFVSVPGQEGSLGILADHAPIVALLKSGEVLVRQGEHENIFDIGAGVVEVSADRKVLILTDSAEEKKDS